MQQVKYVANARNFSKIHGSPVAYWWNESCFDVFAKHKTTKSYVQASVGIQVVNQDRYIHMWWEIEKPDICFDAKKVEDSFSYYKWYPYNKGGDYRKWYGNDYNVIEWINDGSLIKEESRRTGKHYQQYDDKLKFKKLITWSRICSGQAAFRYKNEGFLSDMAGFSFFSDEMRLKAILANCNSCVSKYFLKVLAPTLNFMIGQVSALPISESILTNDVIIDSTNDCISISKTDRDSFENSWDFKKHPLI